MLLKCSVPYRSVQLGLALMLVCLTVPIPCAGQATGSIAGSITDPTGATVPDVALKAVNVQTGLERTQTSAADGTYSIPLLPVGEYRLEVEQAGFQRVVRDGLVLTVSETLTGDIELVVGQLTESVTVTGAAPLINTQTGTLQGLVDEQRMVELPLNGRTMTEFMILQAGVIQTADRSNNSEGLAFSVGGSRSNGVYFLMDGGFNTNAYRNLSGKFPNPDSVQEFSVQPDPPPYAYHPYPDPWLKWTLEVPEKFRLWPAPSRRRPRSPTSPTTHAPKDRQIR